MKQKLKDYWASNCIPMSIKAKASLNATWILFNQNLKSDTVKLIREFYDDAHDIGRRVPVKRNFAPAWPVLLKKRAQVMITKFSWDMSGEEGKWNGSKMFRMYRVKADICICKALWASVNKNKHYIRKRVLLLEEFTHSNLRRKSESTRKKLSPINRYC